MKKIILIAIILTGNLNAFCQQTSNEVVDITLPKETKVLSKQEYSDISNERFKTNNNRIFDHFYQKDGILISYANSSVIPVLKRPLESEQKQWVSLNSRLQNTKISESKIIVINNRRFLTISYQKDGNYMIRFRSDYDLKNRFIYGDIQYKSSDTAQVNDLIIEFLKGVHFKS